MKKIGIIALSILIVSRGMTQVDTQKSSVNIIKFNSSQQLLAIGYDNGKIELWSRDGDIYKRQWLIDKLNFSICFMDYLEKYQKLIVGYEYLGIAFIDLKSGIISKAFNIDFQFYMKDNPEVFYKVDYNKEKNILAVAGDYGRKIILINIDTLYNEYPYKQDTVYTVITDDWVQIFPEPEKSNLVQHMKTDYAIDKSVIGKFYYESPGSVFTVLKISNDASYIAAGTKSGKIVVWPLSGNSTKYEPDHIISIMGSRDQTMFKDVLDIECNDSIISAVSFYSTRFGQLQFWNKNDGSLIGLKKEADRTTCRYLQFNSDKSLFVTTGDISYRLWRTNYQEPILIRDIYYAKSVAYGTKQDCVAFLQNDILAIGDNDDVYFYKLEPFSLLYTLKKSNTTLEILERQ